MKKYLIICFCLLSAGTANAVPVFSNTEVVTNVTNMATFDGISGSLLGYTEDGIITSVNDTQCCFSGAHYGSGGNYDWVTISLVGGGTINSLDFLLGDGWGGAAFDTNLTTNMIWETFSGATSTGFGDLRLSTGSTVGWTDISGFTSLRVAANAGNINAFGEFQAIALGDVRIGTTSVPEPSIIALLSLGLVGIGFARRKA